MRREFDVLVLEDDPRDEAFIEEQLQQLGSDVHTHHVETADELMSELKQRPPDLAILDHGQPALSAYEALSLIKQERPEVPCIVLCDGPKQTEDSVSEPADRIPKSQLSWLGAAARRLLRENYGERWVGMHEASHSEEQLRLFIEAAHDYAIYMLDAVGRVASWNSGAQRLSGYGAKEVTGQHFSMFFPPDAISAGTPEKNLEQARTEGHSESEGWRVRKDGGLFWCQSSLAAVRDAAGELIGFLNIAHDVSQVREAQQQLEDLNKALSKRVRERTRELEALNKELEAFTYSVAHDLRAPLRHINAFAEHLKGHTEGKLDSEDRDHLEVIARSARTLSQMVSALLNLSRLGRKAVEKTPVNLPRMVRQTIAELGHDFGVREVKWTIHPLPSVEADPILLRQVFLNLIENALKYTRDRNPAYVDIGATETDREHIIYIRDNGVGFDMDLADKLFGVFQRLHRDGDFDGSGVGLAIVRRIVQKHGGRTWAEGAPDKGATFYFSLPK
jgi:PAS domain S-box-containing protein